MSILQFPSELQFVDLTCALCRVKLSLARATCGLLDAHNQQTFICISHLFEVEKLIMGWADFIAQERTKYLRQEQDISLLYREGAQDA